MTVYEVQYLCGGNLLRESRLYTKRRNAQARARRASRTGVPNPYSGCGRLPVSQVSVVPREVR